MVDVAAKKRAQEAIAKNVLPKSKSAFTGAQGAKPELIKAMQKVGEAIKKGDSADNLLVYRRELIIKMRAINDAREWAGEALHALDAATADDDAAFEADADDIEKLRERLTKTRDDMADCLVKAKKLEDAAKTASDAGDKTEKTAHREWDVLISEFERATALVDMMLKKMRARVVEAEAAVKARDVAALKTIQETMREFASNPDVVRGKLLLKRTNEFLSKYDLDTLSRAFVDEMAKDRATTVGEYDKHAQALEQEAEKLVAQVAKLKIAPRDAVKATAVLGFKANFIAKVDKALELDDAKLPKALEDIAKQAGVKATGKELVEKLKKAKLL